MRPIDADALIMEMDAGCMPIMEKGISGVIGDESCIKDYIDKAPTIATEPEAAETTGTDISELFDVTIALYFEVHNSEMWGGKGSVGYTRLCYKGCRKFDYRNINNDFLDRQIDEIANSTDVDRCNVRLISKQEYEDNTGDDEDE